MKLEEKAKRILGDTTHLKVLLRFYESNSTFDSVERLAEELGESYASVRKAVSDLCEAGILKDILVCVGRNDRGVRIVMLNENNPYTEAVFSLLRKIEDVC